MCILHNISIRIAIACLKSFHVLNLSIEHVHDTCYCIDRSLTVLFSPTEEMYPLGAEGDPGAGYAGGSGMSPVAETDVYYTLPFAIALLVLWALTVVLTVSVISVLVYRRFCRPTRRFQILGKTDISTISMDSDVLLTRSTENVSTVF